MNISESTGPRYVHLGGGGGTTTTWFTCAPVLPGCLCTETMEWSRNGAWLTPISAECKLWRKKKKKKNESGAKREGQSGFRKQDIFKVKMTKIYTPVALFQL